MKFNNLSGFFSYKVVSVILFILCILIALAFSNTSYFDNDTSTKEGLLTLGDAVIISSIIRDSENAIWKELVDNYKDQTKYPTINGILAESSSPSSQFAKLRSALKPSASSSITSPPVPGITPKPTTTFSGSATETETKELSNINFIISTGYKAMLQRLMKDFGTNVDVNASFTQGCDGAEACVTNTKVVVDSQMSGMGAGGA